MKREISIQSERGTERNDSLQAWTLANGVSPSSVPASSTAVVDSDAEEITFTVFDLNADGTKIIDYVDGEPTFRKHALTVPLVSAPEDHNL